MFGDKQPFDIHVHVVYSSDESLLKGLFYPGFLETKVVEQNFAKSDISVGVNF